MPFCRDCEHCQPVDGQFDAQARCERLTFVSPVTGETHSQFCTDARSVLMGDCGPDARLFLARMADGNPQIKGVDATADATIGATALAG